MYGIGNKWNKQIYKWIATVLGIALLANQFNMTVSASEQIGVDILTESGDIAGEENNAESAEVAEGEEKTEPVKNDQAEENGEGNNAESAEAAEGEENTEPVKNDQAEENGEGNSAESAEVDEGEENTEPVKNDQAEENGEGNNAESAGAAEGEEKTEPVENDQAEENGEDGAIENEGEAGEGSENDVSGEGDVGEYGTISENAMEDGSDASDTVENGSKKNVSNSSKSGGDIVVSRTADVVFVIDVSGSMTSHINKVKGKIAEFIDSLDGADVDVRIKFVLFSDIAIPGEATVCSAWCSNVEEATAALNNIKMLYGGSDAGETPLDGMGFMFQDDFEWRDSVTKFSILLTDEPYKEDNTFGYEFGDITGKLEENGIVSSVIVSPSYDVYDEWVVNEGKKAYITSDDYSFLLDWVGEVILPGVGVEVQKVTIKVKIDDGEELSEHGRNFILKSLEKGSYVKNLKAVVDGTYRIYEVTASGGYLDTEKEITVAGEDAEAVVNYYTVTFYDGDTAYDSTSGQAPQIVLNGQTASRPNPPTKPGYSFNEWVTENNGTTPFDFSQGIGGTTSVYARWSSNTYSVDIKVQKDGVEWEGHGKTFYLKKKDTEDDATDTWITNLTAAEDGTYRIYEVTASGGYLDTEKEITVAGEDAEAEVNYYTVTFYDGDTAYDSTSEQAPQIVLNGQTASRPNPPTKPGYSFNWVTEKNGTTPFDFSQGIGGTTSVYARWSSNTYSVDIKVQKDSEEWEGHGKTFYLKKKDTENDATDTWITNLTAVGAGTYDIYDATNSAAIVDTDVTVTVSNSNAEATVNYCTVTFYDDATAFDEQIILSGTTVHEPSDPEKEGCIFNYWSNVADGSEEFRFSDSISEKTDVYASWLYTVVINSHKDGGSWDDSPKTFALAVEDEENIVFCDGLNVPKGIYKVYDTTGATDIEAYEDTRETVTVSGVGATATVEYYTVTLYNDGEVWETPQTVRRYATASEPAKNPTKEGHTFYRWTLNKDDSSTGFSFGTPIIGTTNLYASWTKDPDIMYTITVSEVTGGSISPNGAVQVKAGDNQQFVITPDEGYQVKSILVDGGAVELDAPITYASATEDMDTISGSVTIAIFAEAKAPANTTEDSNIKYYTFENVTEDHTLTASFERVPTKKKSKPSKPSGSSDSSDTTDTSVSSPIVVSHTDVIIEKIVSEAPVPSTTDSEPKTDDTPYVEIYVTISMISGFSYLLLYFADGESGMTEKQKKEIVAALIKWARKGTRIRKYVALAIIFVILVYYHSIGKRTAVEWKKLYEKQKKMGSFVYGNGASFNCDSMSD